MHIRRETSLARRIKPLADTPRFKPNGISTRWIDIFGGGKRALSIFFFYLIVQLSLLELYLAMLQLYDIKSFIIIYIGTRHFYVRSRI